MIDQGGDLNSQRMILVIGASHTDNWVNVFKKFGEIHHYKVLSIIKTSCYFSEKDDTFKACKDWNKKVLSFLSQINNPQDCYIATTLTRIATMKDHESFESYPEFKSKLMNKLIQRGFNIVGIRDVPRFSSFFNPVECSIVSPDRCAVNKPEICNDVSYKQIVASNKEINFIDLNFPFCNENQCKTIIKDPTSSSLSTLVFADPHGHLRQPVIMKFYDKYDALLSGIIR